MFIFALLEGGGSRGEGGGGGGGGSTYVHSLPLNSKQTKFTIDPGEKAI